MGEKEMKACVWYIDVTLDNRTDTHTVKASAPITEFTAIAHLLNHRLRRFSNDEQERVRFECTPAVPPEL